MLVKRKKKIVSEHNSILVGQCVVRAGTSFLLYSASCILAQETTGPYSNSMEFTAACIADRKIECNSI